MPPANSHQEKVLQEFRKQLVEKDLLHDGDTIGTDDETLLYEP
jgi:hypothetical protein